MKERIIQPKKITTDSFSIPALRQPTRGFGLQSSGASFQPVADNPLAHDISRIPLRRPQAKLTINQPGDIYEQQADTVAQDVVGRLGQLENHASIQRQQMPQEEQLQMQPLANSITPLVQREEIPEEEEEELQMKSLDDSTLQRESAPEEEEEELQMKPMVQRQGEAGMAANRDLEASINQARGSGQPIADDIRQPMEQAFGADFSGVKVHTDAQSDELNQSIQARAFTTGQDVFFRQGEYNPGSRGGQELLAHELTHVVQQNGGAVQRSQPLEREQDKISQSKKLIGLEEDKKQIESRTPTKSGVIQRFDCGAELTTQPDLWDQWIISLKENVEYLIDIDLDHIVEEHFNPDRASEKEQFNVKNEREILTLIYQTIKNGRITTFAGKQAIYAEHTFDYTPGKLPNGMFVATIKVVIDTRAMDGLMDWKNAWVSTAYPI